MTNEIKAVEERIELVSMLNGVFNVKMKGNWRPQVEGTSVMTAESVVEEFYVESIRTGEYQGNKTTLLIGTDYHNRELSLPVSRAIDVHKVDTDEQTKLKTFNIALDILKETSTEDDANYALVLKMAKDLESQGVTEYVPRREQKAKKEDIGITFEEAVELLEEGLEITLECDGYSYDIAPSEDWVGGDGQEGYISLVLGNVVYDSAEYILKKSIDFLKENGKTVVIEA
ncbi:hypothetical protein [Bacillus thuringiensis]|uniref:hypothetical protein n=1 Tax=Bacillus thuringiensis TaxID=1428 RepID=UPI001F0B2E4A|nr:hypothetical protein [Bacillus thuringiensis]MDO6628662.1 hypothetical protein [Bacillus thuringiensis]MDO6659213.1 hypothetical protein [Bacillus thuringiensis]MDO6698795.1 hypothetical protein [Bacillus thuringiensis]